MSFNNLHLIKNGSLAYYSPTLSLISLNNLTYNVLSLLEEGLLITDVAKKYNIESEKIQSLVESVTKNPTDNKTTRKMTKSINRITLHVANDCNLRCKYCYANGGNYNQERGKMTIETARRFVDFSAKNFDNIHNVVFFGGEPMLNLDVMEMICDRFKQYYQQGKTSFLPKFGIITNGTILNPRVISFIRENVSFITVSIDGPKEFNDANRVFANGSGSYDKISQFIHTIKKETNVNIRYEATFTQYHVDKQLTHGDIVNALAKEFNINGVVIDEMTIEEDALVDYWNVFKCENLLKENFTNMPQGFWSVASAIASKTPKKMCAITKEIFAIGSDGEIYPCHMNNGEKQNSLGNIWHKNIFSNSENREKHALSFELKENETCNECWANNICGGCAMKWFYDKNEGRYKKKPNEELCRKNKKHLENTLSMIGYIRKDPILWEALINKLQEKKT